jgi:hypothetical protein
MIIVQAVFKLSLPAVVRATLTFYCATRKSTPHLLERLTSTTAHSEAPVLLHVIRGPYVAAHDRLEATYLHHKGSDVNTLLASPPLLSAHSPSYPTLSPTK